MLSGKHDVYKIKNQSGINISKGAKPMNKYQEAKLENHSKSNFELLRIISMILIVAHHFSVHGGFIYNSTTITINRLWIQFIQMGGKIGVNIFVIITGYFLVTMSSLKITKILMIWGQVFFYSVGIYLVFLGTGHIGLDIKELLKNMFPFIYQRWWFASTYIILYILSPFINKTLTNLSKKDYRFLVMIITVVTCIIPTFFIGSFEVSNFTWFVSLYIISGYIRIWEDSNRIKSRYYFGMAACIALLTYFSVVLFDILGLSSSFFSMHATYFYGQNILPIFLISLFLFLGFKNIEMGYSKTINTISSATFGVYLIHENYLIREWIWKVVFKNSCYADSPTLILYSLLVIIIVFGISTIIDIIRIHCFEKCYYKNVIKIDKYIQLKYYKFLK